MNKKNIQTSTFKRVYCVVSQTGSILTYSLNFSYFKIAIILYSVINSSSSHPLPCSSFRMSSSAFHSYVHSAAWISNSSSFLKSKTSVKSYVIYLMPENDLLRLLITLLWVQTRDDHRNKFELPIGLMLLLLGLGQIINQTHQALGTGGEIEETTVDEPTVVAF